MGPNRWGSCRIVRSYAPPAPRVASVPRKRDCGERTPPPVGYSWPSGPGSPIRDYPRDIATAPRLRNTSTPVFAARGSGVAGTTRRGLTGEVHVIVKFQVTPEPGQIRYIIPTQAWPMSSRHDVARRLHRTVATSTSLLRSTETVETRVTTVQCACRHTDGQWHRTVTHTSCSHTRSMALTHVMLVGPLHFHT